MSLSETEYRGLDAAALAGLVSGGQVSPAEVLEVAIASIDADNPSLNAVIHPLYDAARDSLAAIPPDAPFAGVPLLLKDLGHHLAGAPQTLGNAALRDVAPRSTHSSELVERLARAGCVFPGKTNVPEFGLLGTTEPLAFGPSRNPFDPTRTPGGSSGGSAAMVAAGAVPVATANDGGGSIRIPASYCSLVGHKPSRGLVSNGPHYAELWDGLNSDLVVSRSVRDTVGILACVAGPAPGDPYGAQCSAQAFEHLLERTPGSLRIALDTRPPVPVPVDDSAVAAARQMAGVLAALGHEVEEARPAIDSDLALDGFSAIYLAAAAADYAMVQAVAGKSAARRGTEAPTRFLAYLGRCLSAGQLTTARRQINVLNREMGRFLGEYDVYLTPTTAGVAHLLGAQQPPALVTVGGRLIEWLGLGRHLVGSALLRENFLQAVERVPFTQLANLAGLPSVSVPGQPDAATGLPVGVMLTAAQGRDDVVLQLAAQVEQAQPWADRYPFAADKA